ncbi:MAG TPA: hypothetical protein GX745_03480 [Clostridiales bacterium]|nr:hypothetical protein [Clostridiales bacterium]
MSAQVFHELIYTPIVENSDYYYTFEYLENWYGSTDLDLFPIMVNLIKEYENEKGYNEGYNDGKSYVWDLIENDQVYNAKDIILGIFDAPLRILEKAFTFEIFGIEIYNIILFIMTMGVVWFVWKKVKK